MRPAGAEKAMGLVEKRGSRAKVGTTERWVVPVVLMPMKPRSVAIVEYTPAAP